jgi:hypothetical protein
MLASAKAATATQLGEGAPAGSGSALHVAPLQQHVYKDSQEGHTELEITVHPQSHSVQTPCCRGTAQ